MIYSFPLKQNNHLGDWYRYDGLLQPDDINYLLNAHKDTPSWQGGVVMGVDDTGVTSSEVKQDIRNVSIKTLNLNDDNMWLFDRIGAMIQDVNQYYQFDLSGLYEQMQLLHYGEDINGGHYDWHMDTGCGAISNRKLTVIIQLSDESDYEGCDVEIFKKGTLDKTQGSAFVFPSNMYHRVTPLTKGNRNSVVAWVNGPPFK